MKHSRIAAQLRGLVPLKPTLESADAESTTETGPGSEAVVKTDVDTAAESPNQTTEETTPAVNDDVSVTTTEVGERSDLESAQTKITAGEGEPVVSSESTDEIPDNSKNVDATIETGPEGEGVVKQTLDEDAASPNQTTEETTPAENQDLTTKTVEVGERSDLEEAETTATEDGENVVVSTESLTLAAIGLVGLGAAFSAWAATKFQGEVKTIEKLQAQIKTTKDEINKAEQDFIARAKAVAAKAKPAVSQEGVGDVVRGVTAGVGVTAIGAGAGLMAGGPIGAAIGALLAAGAWTADYKNAVEATKKKRIELQKLEVQLADRQLDLATRVAAAEKQYKVSNESVDGDSAAAAAAAFAEGAAGAAEAAAAASDTGTVEVTEVATDVAEDVAADVAEDVAEDVVEAADDIGDVANLDELEDNLAEGDAHIEEYEQAATTMESLIEALTSAQRSGGLTPQGAQFATIAFESVGVRLTGAPFKNAHGESAMPSLESFGGTMRRDEATTISLENAKEWFARVWDVIKKTWVQIKEWLVKFFETVFTHAGRIKAKAEKVATAAKSASGQPKNDSIDTGAIGAKIAIGSQVRAENITVLESLVKESSARGAAASRGIIQIRQYIKEAADKGFDLGNSLGALDVATSGELRSDAFKNERTEDGVEGFATDVLPGNYVLFTYMPGADTNGEDSYTTMLAKLVRGSWQSTHGYPVKRLAAPEGTSAEAKVAVLQPSAIAQLAERAKKVVEAFEGVRKDLKAEALDLGNVDISTDLSDEQAKSARSMVQQLTKVVRAASNSQAQLAKAVIGSAGGFVDYAALHLKQYGVAEAAAPAAAPAATAAA